MTYKEATAFAALSKRQSGTGSSASKHGSRGRGSQRGTYAGAQHAQPIFTVEPLILSDSYTSFTVHSLRNVFFCLSFLGTLVASEDEAAVDNDTVDIDDDIFSNESDTEWYMVLVFSLMFGFFITLFGAMVAYFSVAEDLLMRRYIREGELIRGDVMSAEFARGGGRVGVCTRDRQTAEYITFVEYNRQLSTNYTVRVRKQIKARETDFVRPLLPGSKAMLKSIKVEVGGGSSAQGGDSDDAHYDYFIDDGPINKVATNPATDWIELYILPNYPKSGHPRRQVERACGWRYRLSTAALILFDLALAAFCTRIAAVAIVDLEDMGQRRTGWYAIGIFLALVVMQVPLIHCFLQGLFVDVLREEYLEHGEFVPVERDDSSLSSAGSDAYLTFTRCISPVSAKSSVSFQ